MKQIKASVDDDLAEGVGRLAARSDRTVAAEVRQALRFWVDSNVGLDDGAAPPVASSSGPPPPIIPVRSGKQRTTTCVHRRPVSSFCRYCDA